MSPVGEHIVPPTAYDNINPRIYIYILYVSEIRSGQDIRDIHARLESALAHAAIELPFLRGKVCKERGHGNVEAHISSKVDEIPCEVQRPSRRHGLGRLVRRWKPR